ncbi:hypothetical protein [Aeromonas caviae]|uniref:hypothetical protein n=1 Tax=Aeromonas caviae TaxID=648 RepID=UPI0019456E6D|nr:hypothetical protein [Aeromonas caviae]
MTWPPARGVPGALAGARRSPPADAPATRDPQLQGLRRRPGHQPGAFLVRSPPPLDHRRPAAAGNQEHLLQMTWPSARDVPGEHPGAPRCAAGQRRRQPGITSCRGGAGDMATGPGRSWCAGNSPQCVA